MPSPSRLFYRSPPSTVGRFGCSRFLSDCVSMSRLLLSSSTYQIRRIFVPAQSACLNSLVAVAPAHPIVRPIHPATIARPAFPFTISTSVKRLCTATPKAMGIDDLTYLGQQEAQAVDEELMGPLGFSVDQLMELAGLSVAQAVRTEFPPSSHRRVLIIAGPGNNGGDGLVAGRHLHHFGYTVQVCYPKRTDKPLYHGLVKQLEALGIEFLEADEVLSQPLREGHDLVLDSIFGFSFKGDPRPPFDSILEALKPPANPPTLVAIDSPSGWDIEEGDVDGTGVQPDMLMSLTAPKKGAKDFKGKFHYLGGRFVPPAIREKYHLKLPEYPGSSQCVRLGSNGAGSRSVDPSAMRMNYGLAERTGGLLEQDVDSDPLKQFDKWFKEAADTKVAEEPNQIAIASVDEAGRPSVRMVLLKGYDERGFIFYTNYDSRKGRQLQQSGAAAFCMYWEPLQRQIRVEGSIEKLSEEESTAYFHSRPRGSQIGAIVSNQSQVITGGRAEIEERAAKLKQEYADESKAIPKPSNWGGFLIRPMLIEFWHGRPSRLHDRLQFTRAEGGWKMERLAP